jgi:signal transduction histidine kinase/ActR/RegA family two-component response regulator
MSGVPPGTTQEERNRLERCIRDLVALNALPSVCVGRSPAETLEIVLDALPAALSCDLLYLRLPGSPPQVHIVLDRQPAAEATAQAVAAAIAGQVLENDVVTISDAGLFWCFAADLPIGHERGTLLAGWRRPLHAVTDRVLVRSAANLVGTTLEAANLLDSARRKDEFLAMLGHELRNPLAPILTAVELLGRQGVGGREREIIDRNARHLARLVDDLLDISRVTRGHVEMRSERISLDSVLQRAAEIAGPLIARKEHSLDVASAEAVTLLGDPVRLAQVFGNLLTNAAKFTPPGGKIEVGVERRGERVRVTVRDNGRGLERDQIQRIFEPFVQVDRAQDALHGGLGLGLAIVANLIKRHGGTVSAHSDGRGRGASFVVELPIVAPAGASVPSPRATPEAVRRNVRVLVVDDNVDLAELLSDALQFEGFQTAVAFDARDALTRWQTFQPHAAVLDVGLPQVDGYELARMVRADYGRQPTLIAATGYGQETDRQRAASAGFDCHFVKPVDVQDIARVLDRRVVAAEPAGRAGSD